MGDGIWAGQACSQKVTLAGGEIQEKRNCSSDYWGWRVGREESAVRGLFPLKAEHEMKI